MENKSHAFTVGIFTIALLVAAVLIGLWLNRDNEDRVPYQIATRLSIPGLSPQADVLYRGLEVGRVDSIQFDPKVPGQILINIGVKDDTPITQSTFGTLGYQGVTGIAYVQLDDDGTRPVRVQSSEDKIARIELRPGLLDKLQTKGLAILEQTEQVAKRANELMSPDNQKTVMTAFQNVGRAAEKLEALQLKLEPAIAKMPALTDQARQSFASVGRLADNVDGLTTELRKPDGTMDRLADAIDRVGTAADKIELEALPLSSDVRTSLRALNRTLENLTDRPQSILFGARRPEPGPGEADFAPPNGNGHQE